MMIMVLEGAMRMEVDGIEYDMTAGTAMIIPPFAMHRGYAVGDKPVSLMEIFAPPRRYYLHLVAYQQEEFGDNRRGLDQGRARFLEQAAGSVERQQGTVDA